MERRAHGYNKAVPTKHCVLGYPSANRRSLRSLRSDRDDNRERRVLNSAFVRGMDELQIPRLPRISCQELHNR